MWIWHAFHDWIRSIYLCGYIRCQGASQLGQTTKTMQRFFLLTLLLIGGASTLFATHNRSGLITYEQTGPLTITATIVTYTLASARPADRDTLTISWGDGASERVTRSNGDGQLLEGDLKMNLYTSTHTYAIRGEYIVSMTDPNRNAGVVNVNAPNSAMIAFHIQTTIKLLDLDVDGPSRSPYFLFPPFELAYSGFPFAFNPGAVDPDGDSIAFELIVPMQQVNDPVPNYRFPDKVTGTTGTNTFTLDPVTGDLNWETPQIVGEYNVAMLIKSFRNGEMIDAMVLDMQIPVLMEIPNAVEELDANALQLRIAPNPVRDRVLRIQVNEWPAAATFVIFDAVGRRMLSGRLYDPVQEIPLPNFSTGTYILAIRQGGRQLNQSFQLLE